MGTVKTKTGFEASIDPAALDDMETFELIVAIDKGEVSGVPELIGRILSADQKKALYEHCRKDGRVRMTAVLQEINDIFEGLRDSEKK